MTTITTYEIAISYLTPDVRKHLATLRTPIDKMLYLKRAYPNLSAEDVDVLLVHDDVWDVMDKTFLNIVAKVVAEREREKAAARAQGKEVKPGRPTTARILDGVRKAKGRSPRQAP